MMINETLKHCRIDIQTWPFQEKHTETPFKIMTEIRKKEEKQAGIGLLCMRIAKFLERSEKKDITCNTEIAFYDDAGMLYTISAGKMENNILATFDGKGNPIVRMNISIGRELISF
jgi:hypothetical protein